MIKKIRKFSELTRSQKIHIAAYLLFVLFLASKCFLEWKGRDFPKEAELNYSTGFLEHSRTLGRNSKAYIGLRSMQDANKITRYDCSYTAFISSTSGSCMDLSGVEAYLDKKATVGWYYQSNFLGFENSMPQLVSLEVADKHLKTYEEVARLNRKVNIVKSITYLFFTTFYSFLYFRFFYPKTQVPQKPEI